MPFKSKKQMRFLASQKPKVFKRFKKKYGVPKNLNERVKDAKR